MQTKFSNSNNQGTMENTATLREKLDQKEYRQFCKRCCDIIEQKLDRVNDSMGARAIWELFQNAGDLARDEGDGKKAYIKMTLTPDEFIFAHKGKAFTYDTLSSLVKQVSSQSKEEDEDATGQYGTGFITTHSFGKKLYISGSMESEEIPGLFITIKDFAIDRTYTSKDEFYNKMAMQLRQVKEIALSQINKEETEWTQLRYDLSTAVGGNGFKKASMAIASAIKTMPYLMTINPRISEVEIQIAESNIKFHSRPLDDEVGLKVMGITKIENGVTTEEKMYYLTSEDGNDVIILPLASPTCVRSLDGMAKLFVNYPLLGTEDFGFEFIFHSKRFIPEEERNGLFLPKAGANSPEKYEKNLMVLTEMSDMLFATLEGMQGTLQEWQDILMLKLEAPADADEECTAFYEGFKAKWVEFYESLEVVDISGEKKRIGDGDICFYSPKVVRDLNGDHAHHSNTVFSIATSDNYIPTKDKIIKWSQVVASWYNEDDSRFLTYESLSRTLSRSELSKEVFLNYARLLKAIGLNSHFVEFPLIKNRDGRHRIKSELRDAATIPDWLCKVVMPFISEEVERFIDEDFVDIDDFSKYSRNDLKKSLNEALRNLADSTFKKAIVGEHEMLCQLARLSMIVKSETSKTIKNAAMKVIAPYLGLEYKTVILSPVDSEEGDIAQLPFQYLVQNLLMEISLKDADWVEEKSDYVYDLHQTLSGWADYYNKNDKKGFAKDFGAFPNLYNNPSMADSLSAAIDIPEELYTLYENVMGEDLKKSIVNPDYASFCEFPELTAIMVAKEIEDKLEDMAFSHDVVLDIIEMFDNNGTNEWSVLFKRIFEKKADLFMNKVKDECKEGIFRLMKIDDADKLNQLAELAEDINLDEIIRLGKGALCERKNKEADFQYKKSLGQYVEDFLRKEIELRLSGKVGTDYNIKVEDSQNGQDLVVLVNNTHVYSLEIKSRWSSNQSVEMSPLQLYTCVDEADSYALCCVNMQGYNRDNVEEHVYPEVEETIHRIKSIVNIGALAANVERAVKNTDYSIHIGGSYSCVVPQRVINEYGVDFSELLEEIVNKILQQ